MPLHIAVRIFTIFFASSVKFFKDRAVFSSKRALVRYQSGFRQAEKLGSLGVYRSWFGAGLEAGQPRNQRFHADGGKQPGSYRFQAHPSTKNFFSFLPPLSPTNIQPIYFLNASCLFYGRSMGNIKERLLLEPRDRGKFYSR